VSLAVEHREGVRLIDSQPEVIQFDGGLKTIVNSSQVDDQLVVDEDPKIIIAVEGEFLFSTVNEASGDLHGETKVVILLADGEVPPVAIPSLVKRPITLSGVGVPDVVFGVETVVFAV